MGGCLAHTWRAGSTLAGGFDCRGLEAPAGRSSSSAVITTAVVTTQLSLQGERKQDGATSESSDCFLLSVKSRSVCAKQVV